MFSSGTALPGAWFSNGSRVTLYLSPRFFNHTSPLHGGYNGCTIPT